MTGIYHRTSSEPVAGIHVGGDRRDRPAPDAIWTHEGRVTDDETAGCRVQIPWRLPLRNPFLVSTVLIGTWTADAPRQVAWQADVQIKTLEVTKARSGLSVRVVIYTEHDDEARDARLLILLPVGAGIQKLVAGCTASAAPSMMRSLRATV
ncbi:MAG TPA: hypothetical protein VFZ73_19230, partial [Gemmatimonadaceae bacterium]